MTLRSLATACLALSLTGCFTIDEDYRFDPDGTVVGEARVRFHPEIAQAFEGADFVPDVATSWCPRLPPAPGADVGPFLDERELPGYAALGVGTLQTPSAANGWACIFRFAFPVRALPKPALDLFVGDVAPRATGHLVTFGGPRGRAVMLRGAIWPDCQGDAECQRGEDALAAGLQSHDPAVLAAARTELAQRQDRMAAAVDFHDVDWRITVSGHLRPGPRFTEISPGLYRWQGTMEDAFTDPPQLFVPREGEAP